MWEKELEAMIYAGKMARKKILEIYHQNFDIEIKNDKSPVTAADKAADEIISNYLLQCFPSYAMLTEESIDDLNRLTNDYCFIVDPVDGTKDFCAKNDEFATNIALAYQHEVVAGVIIIPVSGDIYYAIKNQGAYHIHPSGEIEKIQVNNKTNNLTMLISRFHSSDFEQELPKYDKRITIVKSYGSSIKACKIAEGQAEIHYRRGEGTKEWDIAPIDLLVKEAGGFFIKPDGSNYSYNKEDVYNHEGYIITNRLDNIYKE